MDNLGKPVSTISDTRLEIIDSIKKLKTDRDAIEKGIENLYTRYPTISILSIDYDEDLGVIKNKLFKIQKYSWQLPLTKNFFYQLLAECDREIKKNIKLLNK